MFFETSFGDKIELIPGYRDLFPQRVPSLNTAAGLAKRIGEADGQAIVDTYPPISFKGYASRLARASRMIQFMTDAGLANKRYASMLDLGTGHGLQPMLLKGFGLAEQARGIDIVKRVGSSTPRHLKKRHRQLRLVGPVLDRLYSRALANPNSPLNKDFNAAVRKFGSPRHWSSEAVGDVLVPEYFYKLKYKAVPELDDYIAGDLYEHQGSYDLITAFSALMLFPTEKTLAKISELLTEGGILCVLDPYWWYGANGFPFFGDFPWAGQRLTPEDFLRYVEQFHPEEKDLYRTALDYFTFPQPTLETYEKFGAKYGLEMVCFKRFVPTGWDRGRGPSATVQAAWAGVDTDEVLRDIGRFRGDVCRDDLFTSYVAFALRKRSAAEPAPVGRGGDAGPSEEKPQGKNGLVFRLAKKTILKLTTR